LTVWRRGLYAQEIAVYAFFVCQVVDDDLWCVSTSLVLCDSISVLGLGCFAFVFGKLEVDGEVGSMQLTASVD